jgi:hypothetical protein
MYYTRINPSPTYDISWQAFGSWVATAVETNVAIICASAPALNAYFKGWFGVTGYQEREFGWYERPRWSPWSSATRWGPWNSSRRCRESSPRSTPMAFKSWNSESAKETGSLTVPTRTYGPASPDASRDLVPGWQSRSGESRGTIGRQDSIVPILQQCRSR